MFPTRASRIALALSFLVSGRALPQDLHTTGLAPLGEKAAVTVITEEHLEDVLEVKFVHGLDVRLREGRLTSENAEVRAIDEYLAGLGASRHRVFEQSEEWLDEWRLAGELRSGRPLHDLNLFFRIELPGPGQVGAVCDALNGFEAVQLAYPLGKVSDPSAPAVWVASRAVTPDFELQQGYRQEAPLGVAADYGNTFSGGIGTGTLIADVETAWTDDHEDIKHKAENNFVGLPPAHYPWDHGTAVLGELIGENQGLGVKGLVYDADVVMSSHQGSVTNIPTAVANGAAALGAGDALVIEAQCYGSPPSPFPCEYVASTFATVQTATANGIHVFAAGGNGGNNLDQAAYGGAFNRTVRDSGAVLVGASDGSLLVPASFSNYGTRLDAHGWGYDVVTSGYGDLFADGNPPELREYTDSFSGTSSATPIVTGAGVILNGIWREAFGGPADPLYLRGLLTSTGTPQLSGGNIGPRPNLRTAIEAMGVPRIAPSGTTAPGDTFTITQKGIPGSITILVRSAALRADPRPIVPYGYLLLNHPFQRVDIGPLDAQGEKDYQELIPAGAPAGSTHAFYQGWQRYPSGAGVGAFTNYVEIVVE